MTKMELERVLKWAPGTGKTSTGLSRILRTWDEWPEWSDEAKILKAFVSQFERFDPEEFDWAEWIRFFGEMVQWAYTPEKLALLLFEESRFQTDKKVQSGKAAYMVRARKVYDEIRESFCPELEAWMVEKQPDVTGFEDEEVR